LVLVGSTGRGALEFRPDKSVVSTQEYVDFEKLALEAERILDSDEYTGTGIEELQSRGGSPGGARPKIFAYYEGKEWLVKFRAKYDPKHIGQEEYKYSLLAKACGIEMPETRLFEDKYFGVERFDRSDTGKLHVVSMAGLIGADYRLPSIDYTHIFQVCGLLTHNMAELWKVYRVMVFNYLIGNKDDHAKNFAFIYRDGDWHFSPAYDLLPSSGLNGYHTTSINDTIEPTKEDLIAVAIKAGLNKKEAEELFCKLQKLLAESI
jgi:serine/threonine-protein kinase HipA